MTGLNFFVFAGLDRRYRRQKAEQHKREVLTTAPALWGQMVVIALTLPLLLGRA